MPVRIVEGQKPYTAGTGIEIDTNKVISLLLREENNLIMVNDDNEVYTDLQLQSGLTPQSDFPVGVTVGKVLQSDGWEQNGLILNRKTTSGDYARWIYANDGELYFDKGTGTWNQVYYASEVDTLLSNLRDEIYEYFMKYSDFYWQKPTDAQITLSLSTEYTPTSDFVVDAPNDIQDGQTYILRVNSGAVVYTMTLGRNITNIQRANTNLTANATDMFVFLAVDGKLELQKEINPHEGAVPNDGRLTIQANGTTVATFSADQASNVTANIPVPTVVDNLTSTSTTSALSANQGRELKSKIDDLAGFGKFLSLWNSATGMPISFPLSAPYTYNTGDYYIIEIVGANTNYKPSGNSYTGTASSVEEIDEVEVGDVYVYDGSTWLLQTNHGKTVSFANIAGEPTDNTNLANALAEKQNVLIAGTNVTIEGNTISANNTEYSSATSAIAGIVKLGNDTQIEDTIAQPGTTTGKTYPVQVNASGQMGVNVPWANTTYSSLPAESEGGAVSLVTTGEKYNWNNKQDTMSAGNGISITNNTISNTQQETVGPLTDAEYTALPSTKESDGKIYVIYE